MSDTPKGGPPLDAPATPEGEPTLDEMTERLKAELQKVPADKLKAARKDVKDFLEGDLKWAELLTWTPEKMHETAKEGYRLYDTGQFDKSELIFKGLTVLDPDNFYYHQMLGACFQQRSTFPEAIVEYSIAIDLEPEDITSITNRGEVYYELKLLDLAEQDFDQAIALDPKKENHWGNRSRLLKKKILGVRASQKTQAKEVK